MAESIGPVRAHAISAKSVGEPLRQLSQVAQGGVFRHDALERRTAAGHTAYTDLLDRRVRTLMAAPVTRLAIPGGPVIQRREIVGDSVAKPHPTQDSVNRHIVAQKADAITNERYDVSYSAVDGERDGEDTTLLSDGHHAYVAAEMVEQAIPTEEGGLAVSDLTWQDVHYSEDIGWYHAYLAANDLIDLVRAEAVFDAQDDKALEIAWDALLPCERTTIQHSDVYEYIRDEIDDNDLADKFGELRGENVDVGEDVE